MATRYRKTQDAFRLEYKLCVCVCVFVGGYTYRTNMHRMNNIKNDKLLESS